MAAGIVAAEFIARAVPDATAPGRMAWLGWLSPLGWNTRVQAWTDPRTWVLPLYVVVAAALLILAQSLRARRDLGSGLVGARPGRASARATLTGPFALLLRSQSASLVAYGSIALLLGALFGSITPRLQELVGHGTGQEILDRLGGELIAALLVVFAMVLTPYAISVVVHAARDEQEGRVEAVLATPVARWTWALGVAGVALGGLVVLLTLLGIGMWVGYGAAGGQAPWQTLYAALGWIPACALVAALTMACYALGSRWVGLGWAVFGLAVAVTLIGDVLQLPRWLLRLSPYSATPSYPASRWDWTPAGVMTAAAALILVGAWARFRSRDIG